MPLVPSTSNQKVTGWQASGGKDAKYPFGPDSCMVPSTTVPLWETYIRPEPGTCERSPVPSRVIEIVGGSLGSITSGRPPGKSKVMTSSSQGSPGPSMMTVPVPVAPLKPPTRTKMDCPWVTSTDREDV